MMIVDGQRKARFWTSARIAYYGRLRSFRFARRMRRAMGLE